MNRCSMLLVTREMHTKSSVRYHHAHIPILRNSKNEKNDNKYREGSGTSAAFYAVGGTT